MHSGRNTDNLWKKILPAMKLLPHCFFANMPCSKLHLVRKSSDNHDFVRAVQKGLLSHLVRAMAGTKFVQSRNTKKKNLQNLELHKIHNTRRTYNFKEEKSHEACKQIQLQHTLQALTLTAYSATLDSIDQQLFSTNINHFHFLKRCISIS